MGPFAGAGQAISQISTFVVDSNRPVALIERATNVDLSEE